MENLLFLGVPILKRIRGKTPRLQHNKISLVENSRWPLILKIARPIKIAIPPEWLGIFG